MEIILYTIVAVVLYLVADRILLFLEGLHGGILPYRSVVFFVIILVLALIVFNVLETMMMGGVTPLPDGSFPATPQPGTAPGG